MAAEKKINTEVEIKKSIREKKIIIGKKQVENAVKLGKAKLVVLSRTCFYKDLIANYAKIAGINLINFEGGPYKLGTVCERKHAVNALAILK